MSGQNLLLPLQLDAFILNPQVCNGTDTESKIAPITQPNYSYLRIDQHAARADVLSHSDLHLSSPSTRNPRITNLSNRRPRRERQGVYLHWTLPKLYRSAVLRADDDLDAAIPNKSKAPAKDDNTDPNTPVFPLVPNRWLVVRRLVKGSFQPSEAKFPTTEAWVVESDRLRRIDDLNEEIDLQTDVSPFMDVNIRTLDPNGIPRHDGTDISNVSIADQAEVFIGMKTPAKKWEESKDGARVSLHVLASSNPLFADYQPHNGGVFSILDSFEYDEKRDGTGKLVSKEYLSSATADYYVVGWHSDTAEDILHKTKGASRREKLSRLSLLLPEILSGSTEWLDVAGDARILCHGAMYGVKWDASKKPVTPADDWSHNLNQKKQVSVGTSAIDALLAYVGAHHGEKPADDKKSETKLIRQLEEDIFNLTAHLRAQDDTSVDSYRKAADSLFHHNHTRTNGGVKYAFPISSKPGKPSKPTDKERGLMQKLNDTQDLLNGVHRSIQRHKWQLFSMWFKYFSSDVSSVRPDFLQVNRVYTELKELYRQAQWLTDDVNANKKLLDKVMEAVHPEFAMQGDPTVMVGGVKSGWAHDFLNKPKVRLESHLITVTEEEKTIEELDLSQINLEAMPEKETITKLLREFCLLGNNNVTSDEKNNLPQYHDTVVEPAEPEGDSNVQKAPPLWRDRWNDRQPWFPLFVEWEAEYVHVPWKEWTLKKSISRSSGLERTHYGINPDTDLRGIKDRRLLSGRILLLPQPSFSLSALITQVINTVPAKELEDLLGEGELKKLKDHIFHLPFLSAPLMGLTDHLLTLAHGSHVKPNVRVTGKQPQAILEAVDDDGIFSKEIIDAIGSEMDPTPYGTQIHVKSARGDSSPFKPVTHGQFRFTKLNVIDKFGQAIHALKPTVSSSAGIITDGVIPCVSEFHEVAAITQKDGTKEAHTAGPDDVNGFAEFVQLPPSINQPSRLNACFVKRDSDTDVKSGWRPADEWEDPIWGWIVVNYVDYGIQLFTAEGIFYREVRLPGDAAHGRTTGVASSAWLPFQKTDLVKPEALGQLDKLIEKLTSTDDDGEYLQSFLDMINGALKFSGTAPGGYAEALNCIVGRPLALVNMGWSLELASAPLINQSSMNSNDPEMKLVSEQEKDLYRFPVKLGDSHREFDGLVGYFLTKKRSGHGATDLPLNDELDIGNIYTYFGHDQQRFKPDAPGKSKSPLIELDTATYPKFTSYWLDPHSYDKDKYENAEAASRQYMADRRAKMQIFGAIMDPFQPIHAYSSFLPVQELKLPDWTWQQALNNMTAFFHMGPLVVTKDVPDFDPKYRLRADFSLSGTQEVFKTQQVELPTNIAEWNWLQPYVELVENKEKTDGKAEDNEHVRETAFMPIELGRVDGRPKFEAGPYTAIEGYLQMKKAITDTDLKR